MLTLMAEWSAREDRRMTQDLAGQTAVVVGASSGMGRAIAGTLARAGAHVVASARRADRLAELQTQLADEGVQIDACSGDAGNVADVDRLMAQAAARTGRIDLLVYAAGTNTPQRGLDVLSPEGWAQLLDANLTGAFLCTRAAVPVMAGHGGGLIVYLSSAAVQRPDVSGVAYQASKHGLVGLAHGTRVDQKSHGIRTSVIFPGLCDTEILLARPVPTPREVLDQALQPQDVADAVLFLAKLPARALVPELELVPTSLW